MRFPRLTADGKLLEPTFPQPLRKRLLYVSVDPFLRDPLTCKQHVQGMVVVQDKRKRAHKEYGSAEVRLIAPFPGVAPFLEPNSASVYGENLAGSRLTLSLGLEPKSPCHFLSHSRYLPCKLQAKRKYHAVIVVQVSRSSSILMAMPTGPARERDLSSRRGAERGSASSSNSRGMESKSMASKGKPCICGALRV